MALTDDLGQSPSGRRLAQLLTVRQFLTDVPGVPPHRMLQEIDEEIHQILFPPATKLEERRSA